MNEQGLWKAIEQRIRGLELTLDTVNTQAYNVRVESPNMKIMLGQDTIVLINKEIDVPHTSYILIEGGNNLLETSPLDYSKTHYDKYQFFSDTINIYTKNYGLVFVPYTLEFIRISPNPNS